MIAWLNARDVEVMVEPHVFKEIAHPTAITWKEEVCTLTFT